MEKFRRTPYCNNHKKKKRKTPYRLLAALFLLFRSIHFVVFNLFDFSAIRPASDSSMSCRVTAGILNNGHLSFLRKVGHGYTAFAHGHFVTCVVFQFTFSLSSHCNAYGLWRPSNFVAVFSHTSVGYILGGLQVVCSFVFLSTASLPPLLFGLFQNRARNESYIDCVSSHVTFEPLASFCGCVFVVVVCFDVR